MVWFSRGAVRNRGHPEGVCAHAGDDPKIPGALGVLPVDQLDKRLQGVRPLHLVGLGDRLFDHVGSGLQAGDIGGRAGRGRVALEDRQIHRVHEAHAQIARDRLLESGEPQIVLPGENRVNGVPGRFQLGNADGPGRRGHRFGAPALDARAAGRGHRECRDPGRDRSERHADAHRRGSREQAIKPRLLHRPGIRVRGLPGFELRRQQFEREPIRRDADGVVVFPLGSDRAAHLQRRPGVFAEADTLAQGAQLAALGIAAVIRRDGRLTLGDDCRPGLDFQVLHGAGQRGHFGPLFVAQLVHLQQRIEPFAGLRLPKL